MEDHPLSDITVEPDSIASSEIGHTSINMEIIAVEQIKSEANIDFICNMEHRVHVAGCHLNFSITVESLHIKQNHNVPRDVYIDMSNAMILLDILGYNKADIDIDASMYNIVDGTIGYRDKRLETKDMPALMNVSSNEIFDKHEDYMASSTDEEAFAALDRVLYGDINGSGRDVVENNKSTGRSGSETSKRRGRPRKLKTSRVKISKPGKSTRVSRPKKTAVHPDETVDTQRDDADIHEVSTQEGLDTVLTSLDEEWKAVFPPVEEVKPKRKRIRTKTLRKTPLICHICGYTTWYSALKAHMRTHTGEKPFCCTECGQGFGQAGGLVCHMRKHTGERPFICDTCGDTFTRKVHLVRHTRIHTGEKPHKCDECGACFARANTLKLHKNTHIGDKPHQCTDCGRYFSQKSGLRQHKKIHTGVKDHVCPHCGKAFAHKDHLTHHIRIHTGEKPWKCEICPYTTTKSWNLKKHMAIHR